MNREQIEKKIAAFPLCQYAFASLSDFSFSDKVQIICESECEKYGKSWSCPPAVGTVKECRERCFGYDEAFLFTTVTEVEDLMNMEQMLKTRKDHELVTRDIQSLFLEEGIDVFVLSAEACDYCEVCTYPTAPCRYPDRMFPCVESHGILVTELAERYDISFYYEGNVVTWFSILLLRSSKSGSSNEV